MATEYDYRHQAWVVDGRYVPCGHVGECRCYGTAHAGEAVSVETAVYLAGRVSVSDPCPTCGTEEGGR